MILILAKLPPEVIGGVEKVAGQYAQILSQYERVIYLTFGKNKSVHIRRKQNYIIIELPKLFSIGNYSFSFSYILLIMRLRKKVRLVNIHIPFPLIFELSTILCYEKTIATIHSFISRYNLLNFLLDKIQIFTLNFVYKVIVTSEYYKLKFKTKAMTVETLPLWLDDEGSCESSKVDFGLPSKYVIFIGRFGRYKGLDVLAEVVDRTEMENIQFVVAGSGNYLPDKLKHQKNVQIIPRFVTEAEKYYLLKNSFIFLFPSTDEGEAFGLMQLEAMRQGIPVINTNLKSGVPYVSLDGVSGITIEPNNAKQLSGAISKIYNDKKLHSFLSSGSKNRFNSMFSSNKTKVNLINIFDILDGCGKKSN